MSVNLAIGGALLPPSSTALAGTVETDVFVAAGGSPSTAISIAIANQDTASACRVTIRWSDGTNAFHLFTGNIEAGETEGVLHGLPLVLNPSAANGAGVAKKITAQAAAGGDLTITVIATRAMPQQTGPAGSGK